MRYPVTLLTALLITGAATAQSIPRISTTIEVGSNPLFAPNAPFAVFRQMETSDGFIHDQASAPDAQISVDAGFGLIRLSASSISTPRPVPAGYFGSAGGSGGFIDRMTVSSLDPSLNGQPGRIVALLSIEGNGNASPGQDWAGQISRVSARYGVVMQILDAVDGLHGPRQSFGFERSWESQNGGPTVETGDSFGIKTVAIDFVFGEPFEINLGAGVNVNSNSISANDIGSASINLDAVRWLGFDAVRDANGISVGYSLTSASSTDWSKPTPIPEPAYAAAMWCIALALVHRSISKR